MRQGLGTDLLGPNDPRGPDIGILHVSPSDDRKSVLAALIIQEKLGRKQVVVVLPDLNAAFRRPIDFEDLKGLRRRLKTEIIFIAPDGVGPAEFARQRGFRVYPTLEAYAQSLRDGDASVESGSSGGGKILNFLNFRNKSKPANEGKGDVPASSSSAPDALILGAGGLVAGAGLAAAMDAHAGSPVSPPSPTSPKSPMPPTPPGSSMPPAASMPPAPAQPGSLGSAAGATAAGAGIVGGSAAVPPPGAGGANGMNGINGKHAGQGDKPIDLTTRGRSTGKLPAAGPASGVPVSPLPMNASARGSAAGNTGAASVVGGGGVGRSSKSGGSTPPGGGYWPPPPKPTPMLPAQRAARRRRNILLALLLLLLTLLVACGGLAYARPKALDSIGLGSLKNIMPNIALPSSDVTVNIVPDSQTVSGNYVVAGVSGPAAQGQSQISIRQLSFTTPAQTAKVTGTGNGVVQAKEARGTLEFFNGSLSPYTFGTNTAFTANNGVAFYLDAPVTIPAANPPNFGTATGTAHAGTGGTAGNIPASAIFIKNQFTQITNPAPFTGGVDAVKYTFIQQSDVNSAVSGIQGAVNASARKGLTAELQPGEVLVNQVSCGNPVVSMNAPVGDKGPTGSAASGMASVTETCTGQAYKQAELNTLAATLLNQTAQKQVGAGYALVGNVVTSVTTVSTSPVELQVAAKGVYAYQFSQAQKAALANLIKGMSAAQAIATLEKQTGVKSASIPSGVATLPTSPNQITINVLTPGGLSGGGGTPTPGTTPTITTPPAGSPTPTVTGAKGSVPGLV
jgi:hypothetical protein